MTTPAIFLDRDKTLIDDPGYLDHPDGVRLLPGVVEGLRQLKTAGFRLVVVTNQSAGVELDAIYFCPYHPDGTVPPYNREHEERKPAPGMLLRAAREMDLDLAKSWMVGDRLRDIQSGHRAGCRTVLVRSDSTEPLNDFAGKDRPDFDADGLLAAADLILRT
jgi:D-glycero-D-manno-heptose 1,7-bisphosphate phosphatase